MDDRYRPFTSLLATARRAVSVITVGEMRSGAVRARWGERRVGALRAFLGALLILPVDSEVADQWGRLEARCLDLGRPKGANDLWIAATAKRHGLPLATLDGDQYDIPGLTVVRDDGTEIAVPD